MTAATEQISFAAATAIVLKTYRSHRLPFPTELRDNGDDLLCISFDTIADLRRWVDEAFQHDKAPSVMRDDRNQCMSASLHIWGWKGWTVALYATDPLPADDPADIDDETAALIDDATADCTCTSSLRSIATCTVHGVTAASVTR